MRLLDASKDPCGGDYVSRLREARFYGHMDGSGNIVKLPIPMELLDEFNTCREVIETLQASRESWCEANKEKLDAMEAFQDSANKANESARGWRENAEQLKSEYENLKEQYEARMEDCRDAVERLGLATQELGKMMHERNLAWRQYNRAVGIIAKMAKALKSFRG